MTVSYDLGKPTRKMTSNSWMNRQQLCPEYFDEGPQNVAFYR